MDKGRMRKSLTWMLGGMLIIGLVVVWQWQALPPEPAEQPMPRERLTVKASFPRIIQPTQGQDVDAAPFCDKKGMGNLIACVTLAPTDEHLANAFTQGQAFMPSKPKEAGGKHDAWVLALLFDQLSNHRDMNPTAHGKMLNTLAARLDDYLTLLDGRSASLWHSRLSLASHAFMVATVIAEYHPLAYQRATLHFLDALRALSITEAWPNGFNYWINNRALVLLMATSAYLNGSDAPNRQEVLNIISRLGLWQIYMTRPDHRVENIADEGPRLDLKDESQAVMDLLAKLTQNPVFATYAAYIEHRWGRDGYYAGRRWLKPLIYDPKVPLLKTSPADLSFLDGLLPTFEVFGKGAYNQVVMRSDWGADGIFLQTRAGGTFSHHQHYDAGHFTLFYKQPLLVDGAVYAKNYVKASRLHYSIRTLSKNSLLLPLAGETIRPNKFFSENINPGGQNILMPTGSAITSVAHWRQRQERLDLPQGARLRRAAQLAGVGAFVEFELEQAYNRPQRRKVQRLSRSFLLLTQSKTLLLRDRAVGLDAGIMPKIVFHPKPVPALPTNEAGQAGPGLYRIEPTGSLHFSGVPMRLSALQGGPLRGRAFVGHPYRFWVESFLADGSTALLDQSDGYQPRPWFDEPAARVELDATLEGQGSLIAIELDAQPSPRLTSGTGYVAVELTSDWVVFVESEHGPVSLPPLGDKALTLVSDAQQDTFEVSIDGQRVTLLLNEGVGQRVPGR